MLKGVKIHKKIWKLLLVVVLLYIVFCSRFRMYHLPKGEYVESLDSPNMHYTLKSYRYGGLMSFDDWSLRVELVNNKTKKATNIYYVYHEFDSDMKWIDNETVVINGRKLNIHKDYIYE